MSGKQCSRCDHWYSLSDFRKRTYGHDNRCLSCARREARERYYEVKHLPRDQPLELPAEPFARWLRKQVARDGIGITAHRIHLSERNVRHYVQGDAKRVHIDTVDKALLRVGSLMLRDLYPDLYEDAA